MYKYLLLFWLSSSITFSAMAQSDTSRAAAKAKTDSIKLKRRDTVVSAVPVAKKKKEKVYHPDTLHSPHKAVIRSLLIPGWGQVYNHKWWKVPVIYGALGTLAYYINWNNTNYQEILAISIFREHGTVPALTDKNYTRYQLYINQSTKALYDATDYYRRNRDLCYLSFFGVWGINAIDAYIDAKFISAYTVDDNLSMKVSPGLLNQQQFAMNPGGSFIPAIKIIFTLR
ncbi:MAG TPA: DUF5683 domain-containing protein [Mucilaginibacter sp.]